MAKTDKQLQGTFYWQFGQMNSSCFKLITRNCGYFQSVLLFFLNSWCESGCKTSPATSPGDAVSTWAAASRLQTPGKLKAEPLTTTCLAHVQQSLATVKARWREAGAALPKESSRETPQINFNIFLVRNSGLIVCQIMHPNTRTGHCYQQRYV